MLGTTIICSALVTGDTMSRTVRAVGDRDARATPTSSSPVRGADAPTSPEFFPRSRFAAVDRALRATGARRRHRARDRPAGRRAGHAQPPDRGARVAVRARSRGPGRLRRDLRSRPRSRSSSEVYLDRDAAPKLDARPGDRVRRPRRPRPRAADASRPIVDYDGAGSDGAAVLLPLARAQALLGREGEIRQVLVSNRGDATSGAALTGGVVRADAGGARAARPRAAGRQARRPRARRPAGRRVHVDLHHVRELLGRRRHPADLPDLRDALGRAPHGARHRPRRRHPPRARRADVRVRRARLRPRRRRSSAPRSGWSSPTRWSP